MLELRKREAEGLYPPLHLEYIKKKGYGLHAAMDIPADTLLCEYLGEVKTKREIMFNKNFSSMALTYTSSASHSIWVYPVEMTNLARFFNGINNKR